MISPLIIALAGDFVNDFTITIMPPWGGLKITAVLFAAGPPFPARAENIPEQFRRQWP